MIDPEYKHLKLYDFSIIWKYPDFDTIDIRKPLADLTLSDINWCLRKRIYLHQIIDIVIDIIHENWNKINAYYSTEICEWYDEAIREIITIPFSFWDSEHNAYKTLKHYIQSTDKREIAIEKNIIHSFLSYKPQETYWTLQDSELFLSDLSIGSGMDIAGNIIKAENSLKTLKYAILNNQNVFMETEFISITKEDELYNFISTEYGDCGQIINDIITHLKTERKIKTTANTT